MYVLVMKLSSVGLGRLLVGSVLVVMGLYVVLLWCVGLIIMCVVIMFIDGYCCSILIVCVMELGSYVVLLL